jgi:hypothetical protein
MYVEMKIDNISFQFLKIRNKTFIFRKMKKKDAPARCAGASYMVE